ANATERAVRGVEQKARKDGIYRASLRGSSTYLRDRAKALSQYQPPVGARAAPETVRLIGTRETIRHAWQVVSEILIRGRKPGLAAQVSRFADQMPPPFIERDRSGYKLIEQREL